MARPLPTGNSQPMTIFYEVVSTDTQDADPAELQAVADTVVADLRKEGYAINPVSQGTRGFDFFYQIVPFFQASTQIALAHKDEIANTMNTVKPIVARIFAWHQQRVASKAEAEQGSIELEVKFGEKEDVFRFGATGGKRTEHFQMALDQLNHFFEQSQHAQTRTQPHIVDQDPPILTVREYIPPRRRRKQ